MSGKLFVVATPLGNLDDISPRALETLRSVDFVACEDTRRTRKLLDRYGIEVSLLSCHRFNEQDRLEPLLRRLEEGQTVGLVSDAGTPGVSDPGTLLVRSALERGIDVSPLPGPSAVAALLSVSGLAADRYVFEGFLPQRAGPRRRRLRELASERRTWVIFEAPHRLRETLADIDTVIGARPLVLGRELTKVYETILRGTAQELAGRLGEEIRGEITIAVSGATDDAIARGPDPEAQRILESWKRALEATDGEKRDALRRAARELGLKKAELHRRLAELGEPL